MKPDQNSHRMCLSIPQIIGLRQTFTLVLTASIVLSSQLCTSCIQEDKSTHYLKMVCSCDQPTTVKIIDESTEGNLPRNIFAIRKRLFKKYVYTISQHLFAKIDEIAQCQGKSTITPEVQLVFVYRPLVGLAKKSLLGSTVDWNLTKSRDTKTLDTPWLKLTLDKSPRLIVRAVFLWNERQFLLDQAFMSGARSTSRQPLMPLDERTLGSFYEDYYHSVLTIPMENLTENMKVSGFSANKYYKEAKSAAQLTISKRMPADILWLFSYEGRNERTMDQLRVIGTGLDKTFKERELQYQEITKVLLDRRFALTQTEQRYDSVLDLKDIFNIDKYRINQLY